MPIIKNFQYRADIDGLRAIAVLVVVLFHAGFGCSGGFVGVDVFFVISGYLITSLIWKDLESNKFTFTNFWARRARRIVPPLVVLTIITIIAGWFILLPSDFKSLGRATAAQSIFGANVHYWLDSGYFSPNADEKPLLHTWSLAVEEQFYLIVPFLLWIMYKLKRSRWTVISILGAGFIISLALSIYGVSKFPSATFYLLPTRAWELLTGSILAFLPVFIVPRLLREISAFSGLLLILIPVFLYTAETPFPGLAALLPCLGTALLIYINQSKTTISSILSARPIVFIGLISYSLYLWHWFFLSYGKYLSLEVIPTQIRLLLVAASFIFAVLSWKYVETPFRKRKIATSQKSVLAFAGAGLAFVLICGLTSFLFNGFPQRFKPEILEFADGATDMAFINELTVEDVQAGKLVHIGSSDKLPSVLVWGDSHAMAVLPAFDEFLRRKNLSGTAATHSTTAPILDWYLDSPAGLNKNAIPFNNAVLKYIKDQRISNVVLCSAWNAYRKKDDFRPAMLATIRQITDIGAKPWIMLDVPSPGFNVPKALSRNDFTIDDIESLYAPQEEFEDSFIDEMKSSGALILNPKSAFEDSAGRYIIQINGIPLYRDNSHLTAKGSILILLPFLIDNFSVKP